MLRLRFAAAAAAPLAACGLAASCSHADAAAVEARKAPEPKPPDQQTARTMIRRWTEQEESHKFSPPGSWPSQRSLRGDIPGLRSDLKRCGGSLECVQCQKIAFRLGVALLGGTLSGHSDDGERDDAELSEGAEIMRQLAESGSADGMLAIDHILHGARSCRMACPCHRHNHSK